MRLPVVALVRFQSNWVWQPKSEGVAAPYASSSGRFGAIPEQLNLTTEKWRSCSNLCVFQWLFWSPFQSNWVRQPHESNLTIRLYFTLMDNNKKDNMEVTTGEKIVNHHHGQYSHPWSAPFSPPPYLCYFLMRSKDGNFIRRMRKLMIPDIMTSSKNGGRINQNQMTN